MPILRTETERNSRVLFVLFAPLLLVPPPQWKCFFSRQGANWTAFQPTDPVLCALAPWREIFSYSRTNKTRDFFDFFDFFAPLLFCSLTLRVGSIPASNDPTQRVRLQSCRPLGTAATLCILHSLRTLNPLVRWQRDFFDFFEFFDLSGLSPPDIRRQEIARHQS